MIISYPHYIHLYLSIYIKYSISLQHVSQHVVHILYIFQFSEVLNPASTPGPDRWMPSKLPTGKKSKRQSRTQPVKREGESHCKSAGSKVKWHNLARICKIYDECSIMYIYDCYWVSRWENMFWRLNSHLFIGYWSQYSKITTSQLITI